MKRGFTLIELLVYMAIMGFIIVVAGRVFSDSSRMRVRSQNMVKAAEEVGKVANIINEDISQMGAKFKGGVIGSNYSISNVNDNISASNKVYMDDNQANPDWSSFILEKEFNGKKEFDKLAFRRADFNENGEFLGVKEISWYADNGNLYRSCKTIYENKAGNDAEICPKDKSQEVQIASNVKRFSLFPSAPGTAPPPSNPITSYSGIPLDTVFPLNGELNKFKFISQETKNDVKSITPEHHDDENGTTVEISDFAKNDETSSKKHNEVYLARSGNNIADCMEVPIKKGETYAVEFEMPYFVKDIDSYNDSLSSQFLPGKDHIAVGLRYSDGNEIIGKVSSDVLLYTLQYQDNVPQKKPRYAEFTASDDIPSGKKACVALTFSFYSPQAYIGKLRFERFKIYRKQTGTYHFVKEDNNYGKDLANVYATEGDAEKLAHKRKVKAFELILEIEQNGEVAGTYSRELSGMAIPVPNNGVTGL